MKSLEIANKIQNDFNECFSKYDVATMTIIKPNFYAKEWEQIKQDLEAWNTIKKQLLRSKYGVYKSKINAVVEYNKITMREIKEDEFDREDFNKLKQWLEENENETQEN